MTTECFVYLVSFSCEEQHTGNKICHFWDKTVMFPDSVNADKSHFVLVNPLATNVGLSRSTGSSEASFCW